MLIPSIKCQLCQEGQIYTALRYLFATCHQVTVYCFPNKNVFNLANGEDCDSDFNLCIYGETTVPCMYYKVEIGGESEDGFELTLYNDMAGHLIG
jgi:hypothetical protein